LEKKNNEISRHFGSARLSLDQDPLRIVFIFNRKVIIVRAMRQLTITSFYVFSY